MDKNWLRLMLFRPSRKAGRYKCHTKRVTANKLLTAQPMEEKKKLHQHGWWSSLSSTFTVYQTAKQLT